MGVDAGQPKLWAYLTDGTLSVLASLLAWCQLIGRWPTQIHLLLVFIVEKLDGGGRPIILLRGPCRLRGAWQLPSATQWIAAYPRSYDFTAAGQSAERALWKAPMDDELVFGTGIITGRHHASRLRQVLREGLSPAHVAARSLVGWPLGHRRAGHGELRLRQGRSHRRGALGRGLLCHGATGGQQARPDLPALLLRDVFWQPARRVSHRGLSSTWAT